MAIYYNTEKFAEISKDLNNQLDAGNLSPDQAADYLKQKYKIDKEDWNAAVDEALEHEKKYYDMKEQYKYIPLASANRILPAHLRESEQSTFHSILEAPLGMFKSAVRGTVLNTGQLVGMGLPDEVTEKISKEYKDTDDYLSKNSGGVWQGLKQTFDPETSTVEEMGGLLLSLGVGGGALTKGITALPGVAANIPAWMRRTSGFVAADLLVTDKNENIASGLISAYPETFEFLERLAVDENDSDAHKILMKIIESSALGLSAEAITPFIGKALTGYKRYRAKARAKKDDILRTPEGHSGNVVESKIEVDDTGNMFVNKIRMNQPLWAVNAPSDWRGLGRGAWATQKEMEEGAKRPGWWSRWFGSRQGLDRLTHRAMEKRSSRVTEAEARIRNQSEAFTDSLEKSYGKKLVDFTEDELAEINEALGISLRSPQGFPMPDDIQKIANKSNPTSRERAMLQEFEERKAEYLYNVGAQSDEDLLRLQAEGIERVASESQKQALRNLPQEVQDSIHFMRNTVDEYSQAIIDSGVAGKSMTGRLDSNIGFYISTDYELFSNPKWLKAIKRALEKEGKVLGKGKADDVEALEALEDTRQWYREFQRDEFGNPLTEHQINREIIKFMNNIEEGDLSFLQMMVPGVRNKVPEHALGKILTERQTIPEGLKKLYREITDPAERFRSTVRKQARLLAENEFAKGIRAIAESPYGKNLYRIEGGPGGKEVPFNFVTSLEEAANSYLRSVGSNPLAKVFTTPEYKKVLDRVLKSESGPEGRLQYLYAANALAAGSKTILSHPTHLINIQGNFIFSLANGNILPFALPRHFGKIVGERGKHMSDVVGAMIGKNPRMGELFNVSGTKVQVNRQAYEELQALGLLDSGVNQEYFLRAFDQYGDSLATADGLKSYLGKAYKGIGRIYRAEDGIFKAYNYYAELAKYRKAFPDMPIDELKTYAAEIVKDTLPTYGRIPMLIKETRKYGLVTAFPSFLTESIRVGKNTMKYGIRDFTQGVMTGNTQLARIGMERMAGTMGAAVIGDELFLGGRVRNGITEDDNNVVQRLSPPWDKHAQRFWTGPFQRNPKNRGHIEAPFINMSRGDPYGALKQIAYSSTNHIMPVIQKGLTGEMTLEEAGNEAIQFLDEMAIVGQPILTPSLIAQGVFDLATGKRRKAPHVGWLEEGTDILAETFEPGSLQAERRELEALRSQDILTKMAEGKTTAGRSRSGFPDRPENRWWRHLGVGVQTFDLNRTLQYRVASRGAVINNLNKDLRNLIVNNLGRGAAGIDWTDANTVEEFYGHVNDIILKSLAAQRELAVDLYEAKKFTFNEVIDGRVMRRRLGNEMLDNILTKDGMKKIDKNFDMAIIDNVTRNRIGMFQPPKIPVSILDNPKLIEAGVPKRLIYDLNEYLYKFSGIPLLREE